MYSISISATGLMSGGRWKASNLTTPISQKRKRVRFYDGLSHQGMFFLPKYLRGELSKQTMLITDNEPLYIYQS